MKSEPTKSPERSISPLTIGIDAAETEGQATGVGRYTLEIVTRWIEEGRPDRRYVIFARRRDALPESLRTAADVVTSEDREGVVRWQQTRLPGLLRQRPVDVLFCPAYAVPLITRTPCVMALHDLSFERFPDEFRFKERWRRRLLARLGVRRAARVVTISKFSAREINELYGLSPDRIAVGYPGVDRLRFGPGSRSVSPRPSQPFFLAVGTFLRRRHLDVLIEAFAKLPQSFAGHELVLVGRDRAQPPLHAAERAAKLGLAERVCVIEHVSDDELVKLYRSAELHVSLSAYEGFGLPAAEGLASGAPTLLLDQPVYRELWDGVAHFVEGTDVHAVARAMEQACGRRPDLDLVDDLLQNRYSWSRCARRVDTTLAAVADGNRRTRTQV